MKTRKVRRRRAVATWRRLMKTAEGQAHRPIYHAYYCHLRGHSRRSCRVWSLPEWQESSVWVGPTRRPSPEGIVELRRRLDEAAAQVTATRGAGQ